VCKKAGTTAIAAVNTIIKFIFRIEVEKYDTDDEDRILVVSFTML
jgi:hypothetical protein